MSVYAFMESVMRHERSGKVFRDMHKFMDNDARLIILG